MPSERIQRRIDALLDQAEEAANRDEWELSARRAREALALDAANEDASTLAQAAEAMLGLTPAGDETVPPAPLTPTIKHPSSFVAGRYAVRRFLGEGGKERVYLAHDERVDRDVAFALIKADGFDAVGRERIVREVQAMGRMGAQQHIVGIYEIGEDRARAGG